MSVIGSNILAGASGQGGDYTIARSLRFRSSASAYLNRTPATTTNRKTWTWSAWVKRGELSRRQWLFQQSDTAGDRQIQLEINAGNAIRFGWYDVGVGTGFIVTNALYRDPSAWYHIMYSVDTTQATDTNRVKIYVNGVQVTSLDGGSTYPPQNFDTSVNTTNPMGLGASITPSLFFDGYLTEVNFIDGQALTPSSFGANNASTGVWQPKKYAGTYGTNGFYLPFSDNASTTTLGNDFSGNGNNWTTNNISLTTGSTYDSMTDVPTLTSATASNFAVLNPVQKSSSVTVSQGNLYGVSSAGNQTLPTTIYANSGKWYAEFTCATAGLEDMIGIITDTFNFTSGFYQANQLLVARSSGDIFYSSASTFGGPAWTTGDIIQVKLDLDNQTVGWAKNGGSYTTATITSYDGHTAGKFWTFAIKNGVSGGTGNFYYNLNCGQRPFAYTPPTGFVALNTFNLPTPTIGATASTQANKYFDATTWSGNASSGRAITNSGSFAPALVWAKQRNGVEWHIINDAVRGVPKNIYSNSTNAEDTASYITALNSNGFTVSADASVNGSGGTYVAWQWAGNGSGVSNTAGSITSTVSANTSAGFSVVTYTGNGSNPATIGHGLGVAPRMIIAKSRNLAGSAWVTYHASANNNAGQNGYLMLQSTSAFNVDINAWNNTAPTSSVFSVGSYNNDASGTYVAYCFSDVQGYQKAGSYVGNGSTDGPFVFTGFRPKFVLIKSTAGDNWTIVDTSRNTYNVADARLFPSSSSAEATGTANCDILSNGFKVRIGSTDTGANGNGTTYIYLAIAETPTKYSLAR